MKTVPASRGTTAAVSRRLCLCAAAVVVLAAIPEGRSFPLRAFNQRYLTSDRATAIVLSGSHTWNSIVDHSTTTWPTTEQFNFYAWLDHIAALGHNFTRLWTWDNSRTNGPFGGGENWHAPLPYARVPGGGNAADGGPKFDLKRHDDEYFRRLRDRVEYARRKDMYVSVMLFEGWEARFSGARWRAAGHPYVSGNNVNSINGDRNGDGSPVEVYTLADPSITALQRAYVAQVLATVAEFDNVIIEICNECANDAATNAWQTYWVNFVRIYERSMSRYQHLIWRTPVGADVDDSVAVLGARPDLISPGARWPGFSPAGSGEMPVASDSLPSVFDTDHIWGAGGTADSVWRAFVRGHHVAYMDDPMNLTRGRYPGYPNLMTRAAVGHVRLFSAGLNLAGAQPSTTAASTGYALGAPRLGYIVYQPSNGSFTVNLSGASHSYEVVWLNVNTGQTLSQPDIAGGSAGQVFFNPFAGQPRGIVLRLLPR